jgi:hypothetical protein
VDSELGADTQTDSGQQPPGWWHTRRGRVEAIAIVVAALMVAYLLVLVLRGPSDHDESSEPDPASTTTTTPTPESEVERAYRAFDALLNRLSPAPDPADPEIARLTTGEFRAQFERVMADRRARKLAVTVGPRNGPGLLTTTVDSGSATVTSCYVDQGQTINTATGEVVKAMTTVNELQTLTFVQEDGSWKLRHLTIKRDPRTREPVPCGN